MSPSLHNKNILLGVCGGIAAYKSAELVRRLQDAGADVRVVMTPGAQAFITPLTFQALSGHITHTDLLDTAAENAMGHIELARWADLILVAPATANSIALFASGRADNLLSAIFLASKAKMAIAPAMNHVMWQADATQQNIQQLKQSGVHIFGPDTGSQACGEVGEGRLLDTDRLVENCATLFNSGALQDLNIMITAGPTFEPIDPVRYIGNRSSGRMGFALAEAAVEMGACVTLITGPVHLDTPPHCIRINVETAQEMHDAVMSQISAQAIFIATAAVSDYRPSAAQAQKIKKSASAISLELSPTPDILKDVAARPQPPYTLGFAAETQNIEQYALEKLSRKKCQMIAANLITAHNPQHPEQDTGFNSEYNTLQVYWNGGKQLFPRSRKTQLARQLLTLLAKRYHENTTA